jgi:hypothetical protein
MTCNYHNCGVGNARLRRLVEEALGQPNDGEVLRNRALNY